MRKLPLRWIAVQTVIALLAASGCVVNGRQYPAAKWAMDDPQYAQEHSEPEGSNPSKSSAKRIWDMTDASFQQGNSGAYLRGGSTVNHWPAAIGSTGVFFLPTSWSTVHYGVMGMDNSGIGVGGIEAGIRAHAPTRFTPYIGLSTDVGVSGMHSGTVSRPPAGEPPTRTSKVAGLASIVPEAGVSYWLSSTTRLNIGASYFVAVRQSDFLVLGLSMEFVLSGSSSSDQANGTVPRRVENWRDVTSDDESSNSYFAENTRLAELNQLQRTGNGEVAETDVVEPSPPFFVNGWTDAITNNRDSAPSLLDDVPSLRSFTEKSTEAP